MSGTILVTGSAGLVGHEVSRRLTARGTRILGLDHAPGDGHVVCDLTDLGGIEAVVGGRDIAAIVHCGGLSGPMLARDNPLALVAANINGTANLLEMARVHRVGRFIYCSSASAYGNTEPELVAEDRPLRPASVYGATKAAGEDLVAGYAGQFGIDAVSLRFSWIYGPRRRTDCVIRTMLVDAIAGRKTRLGYGRGFHRQFVHVEDAARAIVAALDRPGLPKAAYNITGGSYLTLDTVADMVGRVVDADIALAPGPDPNDEIQHRFDIAAAERDLGYVPEVGLAEGIGLYAAWLRGGRELG